MESKLRDSRLSLRSLRNVLLAVFVVVYAFLWCGGVGQHIFASPVRKNPDWFASAFLLLAGLIVLLGTSEIREVWSLLGVALFGLVVEMIGVRLGVPFGEYNYSEVLQPQLLGVPIVMAFAWMVLVAGIKQTLQMAGFPRWFEVLLSALWMTCIDLVIDPLAANTLGYWLWRTSGNYYGIPAGNFAGWFISSLAVFTLIGPARRRNSLSRWISHSIVVFFTLIAATQRLYVVALIGITLISLQVLFVKMHGDRNSASQ